LLCGVQEEGDDCLDDDLMILSKIHRIGHFSESSFFPYLSQAEQPRMLGTPGRAAFPRGAVFSVYPLCKCEKKKVLTENKAASCSYSRIRRPFAVYLVRAFCYS
jgi:hypothetical protein